MNHASCPKIASSWVWTMVSAVCFCLAQVGYTWIFAPKEAVPADRFYRIAVLPDWDTSPGDNIFTTGYLRFNNWDSLRFYEIANHGYHVPSTPLVGDDIHHYRVNVTTPPAFPLLVRSVQSLLSIRPEFVVPLSAQLSAFVFWVYFLSMLLELGLSRRVALFSAVTVAFHPAAFYMVVGYTESLFMASMMGFIYWFHRWLRQPKWSSGIFSCVHGFVCTATRLPGFPIAVYPVFQVLGMARRKIPQAILISAVAAMGLICFFVFCQIQFGEWNLYFRVSAMLAQRANYFAFVNPFNYVPRYFFENTIISVSRTAVPWTVFLIGISLKIDRNVKNHFGLYSIAGGLLYLAMAARADSEMDGMIRYTLPIFALLVLCLTWVLHERDFDLVKTMSVRIKSLLLLGYLLAAATQGWMAWKFLHGTWVT